MKKLILIFAAVAFTMHVKAQEKYVTSALTAEQSQNYDEAKEDIDKAISNPETKDKPKTLFAKAKIYYDMQMNAGDKYKATNPYREGAQALFKLIEVKPDYERENVDQMLLFAGVLYYNDGVKAFNEKKYAEATDMMKNVIKITDLKNTRKFEMLNDAQKKSFDTVNANAYQTMANCAYYSGKYDEAIPLLVKVKNNSITKTPTAYECLIDAYNKENKKDEAHTTIEEARKAFPDDVTIRNYELNYYIQSGKQEDRVKKLEDAAEKEPNNADIQFNIATTYMEMAAPKDAKTPPNSADLYAKSEEAFRHAITLAPENAAYNYNFGALYYNEATDVNNQMNSITGSSAADLKKYDDLKAQRDALFTKGMPYFEKAYTVLNANEGKLNSEDMKTYKQSIAALKEIYARQNKMDKVAEMKKKYESLH